MARSDRPFPAASPPVSTRLWTLWRASTIGARWESGLGPSEDHSAGARRRHPLAGEKARAGLRAMLGAVRPAALVAACALAGLLSPPAIAQTAPSVPVTGAANERDARFHPIVSQWTRMLAASRDLPDAGKVAAVQDFFGRLMQFGGDASAWGRTKTWATPTEFMRRGRGDCKDFAVAKYASLRMLGVPADRLRLLYVHAGLGAGQQVPHMVLGFYPDADSEPVVLDNLVDSLRPLSERSDLSLVYGFNTLGLWVADGKTSAADPIARISRWRDLLQRMRAEGTLAAWPPSERTDLSAVAANDGPQASLER
jgi:predicted transglutaminase-like cysteine proteinase